MTKTTSLDIILDAADGAIFSSGSVVRGKVLVSVGDKPVPAKSLTLKLYGTEKTMVKYDMPSLGQDVATGAAEKLFETTVNSYKKHNRAKEATTTGQLKQLKKDLNGIGADKDEVNFYSAVMADFLAEVQSMVVKKVNKELDKAIEENKSELEKEMEAASKEAEKMGKYGDAALAFIKDVREASKVNASSANPKDLSDFYTRGKVYAAATEKFMTVIAPDQAKEMSKYTSQAQDFIHSITGNAHRIKKKGGNSESVATRNIFEIPITLDTNIIGSDGHIDCGDHEVPFAVQLPDSLPSSMHVVESNGSTCRIEYRIVAKIKGSGWFWDHKCKRSFRVRMEAMSSEPLPFSIGDSTTIKSMGLMKQGITAYAAKIDDMILDKGESTSVTLSFRNTAKVNIKAVKVILFQECEWGGRSFGSPTEKMTTELFKSEFPLEDGTISHSKRTSLNQMFLDMNEDLESASANKELIETSDTLSKIDFKMPVDAHSAYVGSLFSVRHYLRIKIKTDSMFTNNAVMIVPLLCGERPMAEENVVQAQESPLESTLTPADQARMGGKAQKNREETDSVSSGEVSHCFDDLEPSLEVLLDEMAVSVHDLDILEEVSSRPAWAPILSSLRPKDFAKIVTEIDYSYEIPQAALLLAEALGEGFTSAHLAAAIETLPENVSSVVLVRTVLPLVSDLKSKAKKIEKTLTDWEYAVTSADFDALLG